MVDSLFRLVLGSWRPATSLHRSHPGRWTPTAFAAADGEPFQHGDGFHELIPLGPKFGKHFDDIHPLHPTSPEALGSNYRPRRPSRTGRWFRERKKSSV